MKVWRHPSSLRKRGEHRGKRQSDGDPVLAIHGVYGDVQWYKEYGLHTANARIRLPIGGDRPKRNQHSEGVAHQAFSQGSAPHGGGSVQFWAPDPAAWAGGSKGARRGGDQKKILGVGGISDFPVSF